MNIANLIKRSQYYKTDKYTLPALGDLGVGESCRGEVGGVEEGLDDLEEPELESRRSESDIGGLITFEAPFDDNCALSCF